MSEVSTVTNWDQLPLLLTSKHMMALFGVTDRQTITDWARTGQIPQPVIAVGEKGTRRWNREIVRQHIERRQK